MLAFLSWGQTFSQTCLFNLESNYFICLICLSPLDYFISASCKSLGFTEKMVKHPGKMMFLTWQQLSVSFFFLLAFQCSLSLLSSFPPTKNCFLSLIGKEGQQLQGRMKLRYCQLIWKKKCPHNR